MSDRLQRWLGGGYRNVVLPSGIAFRLRIPDVEHLVARGPIPDDLRQIALKFGASSVEPETMDTDSLASLLRFMRTMVAYSLQSIWDGPTPKTFAELNADDAPWQPVNVSVGMLEEGQIDGDDYAALQGIVSRRFTPEQITALTLRERGTITPEEAEPVIGDAETQTVKGWRTFRGESGSTDSGDAGGTMGTATVGSGRRPRSRRRSGAG